MINRVLALLGAALVIVPLSVSADIGPPRDIATRARGAGRIVVASVSDIRAQFKTNQFGDQLIISTVVLDVSETLKGAVAARLEVDVEGGTVGDLTLKVSDLPSLVPGERAVFFLEAGAGGALLPHDRGRGILRISQDERIDNSTVTLGDLRRQVQDALRGGR